MKVSNLHLWILLLTPLACSSCQTSRPLTRQELEKKVATMPYRWSYRGSTKRYHYLAENRPSILIANRNKYKISRSELEIPRTFARGGQGEEIFTDGIVAVPRYEQRITGKNLYRAAIMANGKLLWEHRYRVADNTAVPHGVWRRYHHDGDLLSETEYKNGLVHGRHWLDLGGIGGEARSLEAFWQGETPVGTWTVNPGTVKHIVIHFENGREILKEYYGASWGKKLLLWQWKDGRESFKGDWVVGQPPRVARGQNYLSKPFQPEFAPPPVQIDELFQVLARD